VQYLKGGINIKTHQDISGYVYSRLGSSVYEILSKPLSDVFAQLSKSLTGQVLSVKISAGTPYVLSINQK
jgi:hypothetical protein